MTDTPNTASESDLILHLSEYEYTSGDDSELDIEFDIELNNESNNEPAKTIEKDDAKLPKCQHYNRGCYLLFPCCNEFYPCRFCHNETKTSFKLDPILIHEADRFAVETVQCRYCLTVQDIHDTCKSCGKKFGNYFCMICKLLDLDDKGQYHCEDCKICRQGGRDNFLHCNSCGLCVPIISHICVRKIDGECPICCVVLFDSVKDCKSLKCGHWLHSECLNEYLKYNNKCPICSKSIAETDSFNMYLDHHISSTPMPDEFKDKMVDILCNDCGEKCNVKFHFYGLKCTKCSSYNTRQT